MLFLCLVVVISLIIRIINRYTKNNYTVKYWSTMFLLAGLTLILVQYFSK